MGNEQHFLDVFPHLARGPQADPEIAGQGVNLIPLARKYLSIGRSGRCGLVLADPAVSPCHALVEYRDGNYLIADVHSRLGTFVNGRSVDRVRLQPDDLIHLGPYVFRFRDDFLIWVHLPPPPTLAAIDLQLAIGPATLLDHVSLLLQPGEFIGLLGASGAGKTTLLNALSGWTFAAAGQVLLNGERLYEKYESLKHLIGYVPQKDVIHQELTCRQALGYAARLRLEPGLAAHGLRQAVNETLEVLGLSGQANLPVGKLSGGQRKRASVGVELLGKPSLLFLDEPTSGLDPGTEGRSMRLFQRLAREGRIVVCATHVMENVDLFDKVAVLATGGKLAFFGPPLEAKEYFGLERFSELYDRLEEKSPAQWQEQFRESAPCARLQDALARERSPRPYSRQKLPPPPTQLSGPAQWLVLTRRFGRILGSDLRNLTLLVAQPLVIGGLIVTVFRELPTVLFLMVCAALWFSCGTAAQQLVKERPIYLRERRASLRLAPYILSKFLPLALAGAGQCVLLLLLVWLTTGDLDDWVSAFVVLTLAAWNGTAMGLVISAVAANEDKATGVVPFLILPQIILAGALIPLPQMSLPMRALADCTPSRWANQALAVTFFKDQKLDGKLLSRDGYTAPVWNLYPEYDLRVAEGRYHFLRDQGGRTIQKPGVFATDCGMLLLFLGIQLTGVAWLLRRQVTF